MKIISGGQTGADLGGLEAGKELGLETGGWAPKGWLTENGPQRDLLESYGLKLCLEPGYPARTRRNIEDSNGTVIFGYMSHNTPGSLLTLRLCRELNKPCLTLNLDGLFFKEDLLEWIGKYHIKVLNVAGNRESRNLGIQERVRKFLVEALKV